MPGTDGGIAGNDAVEIVGVALRHDHGFAAARGAAVEIRMLGRAPIIRRDHLLRATRDFSNRHVVETQAGLLVAEKAAVENAAFVAAVRAYHRESSRQPRQFTGRLRT